MSLEVLGGSWVVISRVVSKITILTSSIWGLITPLLTILTNLNPKLPMNLQVYRRLIANQTEAYGIHGRGVQYRGVYYGIKYL